MTIAEWLAARTPAPPPALAERVRVLLGGAALADMSEAPARCVEAGARAVTDLLASGGSTRESALDLLAADALLTYAFEAAAENPNSLDDLTLDAMRRIATLVEAAECAR